MGNSVLPLIFLAISSLLNIALDLWFVIGLHFGVGGAAGATVIAQAVSGIGITIAVLWKNPQLFPSKEQRIFQKSTLSEVSRYAFFTCLQQSVMNFGILMIQGLVNSFSTTIMAAFAAAVKIDRNSAMHFRCLSHKIMVQNTRIGLEWEFTPPFRYPLLSALSFLPSSGFLPAR